MRSLALVVGTLLTLGTPAVSQPLGPDRELIAAAVQGDIQGVQRALSAGADIEATLDPTDPLPVTPLSAAVVSGSSQTIRTLLDRGADPRAYDAIAIQLALMFQDEDVVRELLPSLGRIQESDPPFVNMLAARPSEGGAALLRRLTRAEALGTEVEEGDLEAMVLLMLSGRFAEQADDPALRILRLLVDAGAPVDRTGGTLDEDATAVQQAAASGDLLMLEVLLNMGAPLPEGWTRADLDQEALAGAARAGNEPGLRALLGAVDPNQPSADGTYPLSWALAFRRIDLVHVLLEGGADPDLYGSEENAPLHDAAAADRTDIVQALLAAGAEPGMRDPQRAWPLRAAARQGSTESIRLLVQAGADVNAVDSVGRTALHDFGTTDGLLFRGRTFSPLQYDALRALGALGFDFTRVDSRGRSPIGSLVPSASSNLSLFDAFAEAGSPALPDMMAVALEWDRPDILLWGFEHGASPDAPSDLLERAFARLHRTRASQLAAAHLLRRGADLPADSQRTAQMVQTAAATGASHVLTLLLERGLSPDGRTADASALGTALENGRPEIVRFLLEKGARLVSPRDSLGTVVHDLVADDVQSIRSGHDPVIGASQREAIAALIEGGLDVTTRDRQGRTIETIASAVPVTLQNWRTAIALAGKGENDLHRAIRREDAVVLARLVREGTLLNTKDGLGRSPLTLALQLGWREAAQALLSAGSAYTVEPANAYQVADLDYAQDERLAAAFMMRMLSQRILELDAHKAAVDPDTSLHRFQASQSTPLPDAVWTVTCTPCEVPMVLRGNTRSNLPVKSYRHDDGRTVVFGVRQSNLGPVTMRLRDVAPGLRGEVGIELEFQVEGLLRIPPCSFDFWTDPTCYPEVRITNPNHTSEFRINTSRGPIPLPGAIMAAVQNGETWEILPGDTLELDRSRGSIDVLMQRVSSPIFMLDFSVSLGAGPVAAAEREIHDGARAATYARIFTLRSEAARLPQQGSAGAELRAKTLATSIHITSAMAVREKYPQVIRERLIRRAEDIRHLNAQVVALRNAVIAQSSMTPAQIGEMIGRIDRLLLDLPEAERAPLRQIRVALVRVQAAATGANDAVEVLREQLYSDVDRMVRDYQALILEYAQYVPVATLTSMIEEPTRAAIRERIHPADVVIHDQTLGQQGAALRRAFGLPTPIRGVP